MLIAVPVTSRTPVTLAVLAIAGCASPAERDPGLASAIKAHYAAHATEEQGACRNPRIDTIQEQKLQDDPATGEDVVLVRYSYFDRHADMDADWDRLVHLSQPCGGIAERRFVVSKGDAGYRVMDMSGERRQGKSKR